MGTRGAVGIALLVLLCLMSVVPPGTRSASAQEFLEPVLPGCGIAYPGGYDINTVGNVRGKILELQEPEDGPVRFIVAGEGERWVVLSSPAWFWKMTGLRLVPGDTVMVQGSKTLGADGTLYLIAQQIRTSGNGAVIILRDRSGFPLWSAGNRGGRMPGGGRGDRRGEPIGRGNNGGRGRR